MKKIGHFLCCFVLISCSVSKQTTSNEKIAALKENINANKFKIISKSARPMASNTMQQLAAANLLANGSSVGYIDLLSTDNYFTVNKNTLKVHLPFFGEHTRISGYGNNTGSIEFNGIPKKSSTNFNSSKNRYEMKYEFSNNNDYYKAKVEVYLSGKTIIFITSSKRTSITYRGVIENLKE